jgi:hypothetical protein
MDCLIQFKQELRHLGQKKAGQFNLGVSNLEPVDPRAAAASNFFEYRAVMLLQIKDIEQTRLVDELDQNRRGLCWLLRRSGSTLLESGKPGRRNEPPFGGSGDRLDV